MADVRTAENSRRTHMTQEQYNKLRDAAVVAIDEARRFITKGWKVQVRELELPLN